MDRKKTFKTCLITGSNSGIGKATAIEMAQRGYNILMLCRDSEKSRNAQAEIKAGSNEMKVDLVYVDFASLKSIENAASEITQKYDSIDVLINNAGVVKRKLSIGLPGYFRRGKRILRKVLFKIKTQGDYKDYSRQGAVEGFMESSL